MQDFSSSSLFFFPAITSLHLSPGIDQNPVEEISPSIDKRHYWRRKQTDHIFEEMSFQSEWKLNARKHEASFPSLPSEWQEDPRFLFAKHSALSSWNFCLLHNSGPHNSNPSLKILVAGSWGSIRPGSKPYFCSFPLLFSVTLAVIFYLIFSY